MRGRVDRNSAMYSRCWVCQQYQCVLCVGKKEVSVQSLPTNLWTVHERHDPSNPHIPRALTPFRDLVAHWDE